jgi:hypothetical protein
VLAGFCFARLAEGHFGPRARLGILWFAVATVCDLAIGRLTWALGVAVGLAALYATQRGLRLLAALLALLTAAATPLAGLFLGLVATALFLGGRRRDGVVLGVPAVALAAALAIVFPEGGRQPFGSQALLVSVILTLGFIVLARERLLRIGAVLYLAATAAAFVLITPIGGNTTRVGAVFAGPLLACALARRPAVLGSPAVAAVLVGLVVWQWYAPVREVSRSVGDPLSQTATYSGLFAFLAARGDGGEGRVEVPFTRSHWEAAILAPRYPLARGWEKQLDAGLDPLFFHPVLPPARYHAWLRALAVRYVAVPQAPSDPSSRAEVALVLGGLPFLRPVYRDRHWRVFAVTDPQPLASGPARVTELGLQSFTLRFRRPGTSVAQVRFSPYWEARPGCVARAPGGFTAVTAARPGVVRVGVAFSVGRIVGAGRRCAGPRGFSPRPAG